MQRRRDSSLSALITRVESRYRNVDAKWQLTEDDKGANTRAAPFLAVCGIDLVNAALDAVERCSRSSAALWIRKL